MLGIILAGGEGTRFLRTGCCKPLLKIGGRYLIEYAMDHLAALHVSEAVIVVGKYGNRISGALGNCYHGIPVTYVMQPEPLGIVNALLLLLLLIVIALLFEYVIALARRGTRGPLIVEERRLNF